ncbi:MAG: bifunctional phosphoglucose/phosphomannose isomerase [candidate division WOR-3 bacterium]
MLGVPCQGAGADNQVLVTASGAIVASHEGCRARESRGFMLRLVYELPEELEEALGIAESAPRVRVAQPKALVVAGMGGSGIGGEILRSLLVHSALLPVVTVKDYDLPRWLDRRDLCFIVSYSGNTEETLSCYHQAVQRGIPRIVVTSGGQLGRLASARGDVVVPVPGGYPPRAAVAYLLCPLLVYTSRLRGMPDFSKDLRRALNVLLMVRRRYCTRARTLARELAERLPVIYSTSRLLDPIADRWRCQFNENAKVFVHTNYFPELDHNEIVGLGSPAQLRPLTCLLVLSDPAAHERNSLRSKLTIDILKGTYTAAEFLVPDGESPLERVLSLLFLGDLVSVYLAQERNVDPMPVQRIDELKTRLGQASWSKSRL